MGLANTDESWEIETRVTDEQVAFYNPLLRPGHHIYLLRGED